MINVNRCFHTKDHLNLDDITTPREKNHHICRKSNIILTKKLSKIIVEVYKNSSKKKIFRYPIAQKSHVTIIYFD